MMSQTISKARLTNAELIKRLCFIAVFASMSCILYTVPVFKFHAIIFPSFLEFNISMMPIIICAFMLGPWDAAIVVILRCLVKWIVPGTSTQYVGEIADVLIGLAGCIPAGIYFKKATNKYKTAISLGIVIISWVLMGVISNAFINIPWYNNLYFKSNYYKNGVHPYLVGPVDKAVYKITFNHVHVTTKNFMAMYLIFAVVPFNIVLASGVVVITALVHRRLKCLYDMIGTKDISGVDFESENQAVEDTKQVEKIDNKKIIIGALLAVLVIAAAIILAYILHKTL